MSLSSILQIRAGLANFFQPYSATILSTTKSIIRNSMTKHAGGYWRYEANFEVVVSAKRLARDNVDLQLGNVEREIQRIICQYHNGDIEGIEDMTYLGHERIYGVDSNFAKSNWATRILIKVRFSKINDSPYPS